MGFEFRAPATIEETLRLLHERGREATVIAGGTDVLFDLDEGRVNPHTVVSLRHLPWKTLDELDGGLRIGSTLPLCRLETDERVAQGFPILREAVRAVGSISLRHRATLGGNLGRSSPASDLTPILLALDATVDLIGRSGERSISLDDFLVASRKTALRPGELIRSIRLPERRPAAYLWQRVRPANDISQVSVAVAFSPSDSGWRVVVAGVVPRPVRILAAEKLLLGRRPPAVSIADSARRAAEEAHFVTDIRATEAHRRNVVRVMVERAVRAVSSFEIPPGTVT